MTRLAGFFVGDPVWIGGLGGKLGILFTPAGKGIG